MADPTEQPNNDLDDLGAIPHPPAPLPGQTFAPGGEQETVEAPVAEAAPAPTPKPTPAPQPLAPVVPPAPPVVPPKPEPQPAPAPAPQPAPTPPPVVPVPVAPKPAPAAAPTPEPEPAPELAPEPTPEPAEAAAEKPDKKGKKPTAPAFVQTDTGLSFTWEASEFVHHDKPASWYAILLGITAAFAAGFALFHQWLAIAVVVTGALALVVYSRKQPRTLNYTIDDHGVTVGHRFSDYSHFRSYSIEEEVSWKSIDLEPSKRFAQRLTLLADPENFPEIEPLLIHHLPRQDREPDPLEKLIRYIKF